MDTKIYSREIRRELNAYLDRHAAHSLIFRKHLTNAAARRTRELCGGWALTAEQKRVVENELSFVMRRRLVRKRGVGGRAVRGTYILKPTQN